MSNKADNKEDSKIDNHTYKFKNDKTLQLDSEDTKYNKSAQTICDGDCVETDINILSLLLCLNGNNLFVKFRTSGYSALLITIVCLF